MAKTLFWFSDAEWASIGPHIPSGRRVDDQRVIPGILHMLRTGAR